MREFPYPMWVMICEDCGPVASVWEKPGTACSYINYCPDCGKAHADSKKVTDKEQHKEVMSQ